MHRGAHEFPESFQYYHWHLQGKMCRADIILAVYWSGQTQHGRRLLQCHKENGRRFVVYSYCIVWFLLCLGCSETVSCVACLTSARQTPTLTPKREWKKVCMHLLHDFCVVFRVRKQCPVSCVWLIKVRIVLDFPGQLIFMRVFFFFFRWADCVTKSGRHVWDLGSVPQRSGFTEPGQWWIDVSCPLPFSFLAWWHRCLEGSCLKSSLTQPCTKKKLKVQVRIITPIGVNMGLSWLHRYHLELNWTDAFKSGQVSIL